MHVSMFVCMYILCEHVCCCFTDIYTYDRTRVLAEDMALRGTCANATPTLYEAIDVTHAHTCGIYMHDTCMYLYPCVYLHT